MVRPAAGVLCRGDARRPRGRTEGRLGGQANVEGVSGVWKDLTDNVNTLAGNLTAQVRNIAQVTTAVANGDLTKKITVDVQGEIASSRRRSTRWSTSSRPSPTRSRASHARSAPKEARRPGAGGRCQRTWRGLTDR